MRTTTIGQLVEAFEGVILGLTPTATPMQSRRWERVEDIDAVPGGEVRRFFVDMADPSPVVGGIYSPVAIEHRVTAQVYTSYPNLRRRQHRDLAAQDAAQVWLELDTRRDSTVEGTIAGLVSVEHVGWQVEDDTQQSFWGAHVYEVRYLADGLP